MLSEMSAQDSCRAFSFLDILVSPLRFVVHEGEFEVRVFQYTPAPHRAGPCSPSFTMTGPGPRREYPSKPWRRRSASEARWMATRCGRPWSERRRVCRYDTAKQLNNSPTGRASFSSGSFRIETLSSPLPPRLAAWAWALSRGHHNGQYAPCLPVRLPGKSGLFPLRVSLARSACTRLMGGYAPSRTPDTSMAVSSSVASCTAWFPQRQIRAVADIAAHAEPWRDIPGKLLSKGHVHRDCPATLVINCID